MNIALLYERAKRASTLPLCTRHFISDSRMAGNFCLRHKVSVSHISFLEPYGKLTMKSKNIECRKF